MRGWYLFTLRDELGGVELGDDRLEDFVPDGGKNTLVVVETKRLRSGVFRVLSYSLPTRKEAIPGRSSAAP